MRMMGLKYSTYYLSWFIVYGAMQLLACSVQTAAFAAMNWFPNSNYFLVWITLVLTGFATLAFTFLVLSTGKTGANDPEKSKQATMAVSFIVFILVMGIFALCYFFHAQAAVWAICCLCAHVAGLGGISIFVRVESAGRGVTWATLVEGTGPLPSLLGVWGFLVLDTLVYLALTIYLSRRSLAKGKMPSSRGAAAGLAPVAASEECLDGAIEAVRLTNLGRAFSGRKKSEPVVALEGLNIGFYEGQVTALLGQNGAGKTTVINILTGLFPQSEGEATVYGYSTNRQMDSIRAISGVCPQHDLVFLPLTCRENLQLIGAVKGMSEKQLTSGAVEKLLADVGLDESKFSARTDTLSGGQKRKLSLACALIGSPKFVLLDEPTAGMDPVSRRTVWQIISDSKLGRAIILTTHFLDEADALGDRVAILHRGRLQAVGSSHELKRRNATSYHLTLGRRPDGATSDEMLALARRHADGASIASEAPDEVSLLLPHEASGAFTGLFMELDQSTELLGVVSYGLSIPTLQEVFLKITAEADATAAAADEAQALATSRSAYRGFFNRGSSLKRNSIGDATGHLTDVRSCASADIEDIAPPMRSATKAKQMRMGLVQMYLIVGDPAVVFFLSLPPLIIFLLFLIPPLIDRTEPPGAANFSDADVALLTRLSTAGFPTPFTLPFAPPTGAIQSALLALPSIDATPLGKEAFDATLRDPATDAACAAEFKSPAVITLYHNASYANSLPVALHVLDSALLGQWAPGVILATTASLLPYTGDNPPPLPSFIGSAIAPIVLIYAFLLVGMSAVTILVKDRLVDKTTHQMLVQGLSPVMRWVIQATFWCSIMFAYLCVGFIMMLIFSGYTPTAAAVPAFMLIWLFAVPPMFCFCALFNFIFWCRSNVEDVVSQTFCNIIMLLVFYPTLLLSAIPGIRDNTTAQSIITYSLLVVPFNQLSFGLSAIYTVANVAIYTSAFVPTVSGPTVADFFVWTVTNPISGGSSPGPLTCITASLLSAPFWFWALWRIDVHRYFHPSRSSSLPPSPARAEDPDVAEERRRVESGDADGSLIRMVRLRKTFKMPKKGGKRQPPKIALDDLSLAIDGQGCFALLGPNGAGKTTALSVLTGDLSPTGGEAFVAGLSVRTQILDIFKLLGYCPQFGGLFPRGVTLKQHLELYARLKGMEDVDLEAHCTRVMREFGLVEHAHKSVNKLSGGTRRKLMAAVALACEPRVCFLDEPTTGVDVGTRQFLWERIRAKGRRGCALILTTHYMEEADALAQRIGILVNGRLQVLGSPQHLKSVHGGGYRLELKGPTESADRVRELVEHLFPGTKQLEMHGGWQVFEVGARRSQRSKTALFALGPVFAALDRAKEELGIETYTLSQTTLEQVFLNIASAQLEQGAK
mmetsp:Transcript_28624/g.87596  ORF Transcript_28624/g.87596 Transcript_28624/m.87596 type:complete len:1388 (+) Transcript_28624:205-4368(+)